MHARHHADQPAEINRPDSDRSWPMDQDGRGLGRKGIFPPAGSMPFTR